MTISVMDLPRMNADWDSFIMLGRISFNLFASTLAMIL